MTFGNPSTGTLAKLSPQLLTTRGRPIKFTSERLQQIRNLVERGESREGIADLLDVTIGSLQVTCSRLGISLRRPKFDNGITLHSPVNRDESMLSQPIGEPSQGNSRSGPAEPAPAAKPQEDRLQTLEAGSPSVAIRFQYKGTERTTELPLNLDMIGRLAWEAEFRNMSTAELIGELIMGMVKKDLFPEVLGKP